MVATTSTPVLTMFDVVRSEALEDSSGKIRVIERAAQSNRTYTYQLQDRALWRPRFEQPILTLAIRGAGSLLASFVESSFSTEVTVDGDEGSLYCFTTMLAGHITLEQKGRSTTATQQSGLAWRPGPGGRLLISDDNARTNVFLKATDIESMLEHMLDERLRRPLIFEPSLDWGTGLTASLKSQLDFVTQEFQRRDGVANNPVALASLTDLLVSLILRGTTHNYSDRLANSAGNPIPAYVRRAEDFMRAHGAEPIRMSHIAAAAGCSLRTLTTVFRHFRGSTPLAALHAVRLDLAHADLARGMRDASVAAVARRYGFTNTTRFRLPFVAGSVKLQLKSPDMRLFRRRRPPPICQKTNDLLWLDRSWQRVRAGPAFTGRQALREVIETSVSLRIQLAVRLFPQNLCPHLPRPSRERYPNILSGEHLRFGSGCKISRGMDKFGSGPTNSATNLRSLPKELLPCRPA